VIVSCCPGRSFESNGPYTSGPRAFGPKSSASIRGLVGSRRGAGNERCPYREDPQVRLAVVGVINPAAAIATNPPAPTADPQDRSQRQLLLHCYSTPVALAGMPDPRKSRGVRHRLVRVPGAAVRGVRPAVARRVLPGTDPANRAGESAGVMARGRPLGARRSTWGSGRCRCQVRPR
jgi:hypothetical protein